MTPSRKKLSLVIVIQLVALVINAFFWFLTGANSAKERFRGEVEFYRDAALGCVNAKIQEMQERDEEEARILEDSL